MPEYQIDRFHNMLIIGYSDKKAPGEIKYFNTTQECMKYYGADNTISKCYETAKIMGAPNIFTCCFHSYTDFTDIVEVLQQYDFTYICPVDIYVSEYYNNPYRNNRKTFYVQYLLEQMQNQNNSIVIATDKHASLYKDLDAYLSDMSSKLYELKQSFYTDNANLHNFLFVDNNLKSEEWANVILAAMFCVTDIPDYPSYDDLGDTVFHIERWDVPDEQIYFQDHHIKHTSVENLLNLAPIGLTKICVIDRILKYMARSLDFSEFIGRLYSAYQVSLIEKKLQTYMDEWKGWILDKYEIGKTEVRPDVIGTMRIVLHYTVWPKGTTESYQGEVVI